MVQTIILHLEVNGKTSVQLTNHPNESWKINQGEMLGCLDMRSSGYFHVSRETLQQTIKHPLRIIVHFLVKEKHKNTLIYITKITKR